MALNLDRKERNETRMSWEHFGAVRTIVTFLPLPPAPHSLSKHVAATYICVAAWARWRLMSKLAQDYVQCLQIGTHAKHLKPDAFYFTKYKSLRDWRFYFNITVLSSAWTSGQVRFQERLWFPLRIPVFGLAFLQKVFISASTESLWTLVLMVVHA